MRNVLAKVFIGLAITSIGMFAADNSIGTWKQDIARSRDTPPGKNPLTSLTVVNEAADGGVKATITGQLKDGTPINSSFTAKYNGKEYPVTGAPWDTISMKQISANAFTFEAKKTDGKLHVTGRLVISRDGKILTRTLKGTNAEGQPSSGKFIYEKQ